MSTDTIITYWVAIASATGVAINLLVKPLIEALPFANPDNKAAYNNGAHDALIRASNVALNVAGVLVMAAIHNQLTLNNWLPIALQAVMLAVGSHGIFTAYNQRKSVSGVSLPSGGGVAPSSAAVAAALNDAIVTAQSRGASITVAMPNPVKTLPTTDPAPAPAAS